MILKNKHYTKTSINKNNITFTIVFKFRKNRIVSSSQQTDITNISIETTTQTTNYIDEK